MNKEEAHSCPICSSHPEHFLPYGVSNRENAKCPECGSVERYRLLYLYLSQETTFLQTPNRVLDIAPVPSFTKLCQSIPNIQYISTDLFSPRATVRSDVTRLPFPNNAFDYLVCYHVLEHVPQDIVAMQEILRVLKPEGTAFLQVPVDINRQKTLEDPSVSPENYERIFGQKDHVRIYGSDFTKRLTDAGFHVQTIKYVDQFSDREKEEYGLKDTYSLLLYTTYEDLVVCQKRF